MNPTFHRPIGFHFEPLTSSTNADVSDNFLLKIWYRPSGDKQTFFRVYVPKTLQPAFLRGDVCGLHLETLEPNSAASLLIPGRPSYLVLGVQLKNGSRLAKVPEVLQHAWRANAAVGVIGGVVGAALLLTSYPWAGAIALLLGSHFWARAKSIPRRPFVVFAEHG